MAVAMAARNSRLGLLTTLPLGSILWGPEVGLKSGLNAPPLDPALYSWKSADLNLGGLRP